MPLTEAQLQHVAKVYPNIRTEMAQYLEDGVEVKICVQREVPEVGAFAIAVRDSDFWIDCCSTKEEAEVLAKQLGLRVIN